MTRIRCSKCHAKRLPDFFVRSDGTVRKTCNICFARRSGAITPEEIADAIRRGPRKPRPAVGEDGLDAKFGESTVWLSRPIRVSPHLYNEAP